MLEPVPDLPSPKSHEKLLLDDVALNVGAMPKHTELTSLPFTEMVNVGAFCADTLGQIKKNKRVATSNRLFFMGVDVFRVSYSMLFNVLLR